MQCVDGQQITGQIGGVGLQMIAAVLCAMAVLLSSYACERQLAHAGQDIEADPRQRTIEPGEYVLIYRDATFYEVPGKSERSYRAYEKNRQRASEPFERRVVAKAVADHGDWVEVERTTSVELPVCDSRGFNQDSDVTLRFFVLRDDLALATRQRTSHEYDDGTAVELLPGVALESFPNGESRYRAWHDELDFTADVSPKDVGLGFEPAEPWEKEWPDLIPVELNDQVTVGDAPLVTSSDKPMEVFAQKEDSRSERGLVRIQRDCARVTASVPDDALEATDGSILRVGDGGGGSSCRTPHSGAFFVAEPTTPVYWPQGGEAGQVTRTIWIQVASGDSVRSPSEGEPEEVDLCRELTIMGDIESDDEATSEEARQVEYCFDREELDFIDNRPQQIEVEQR